MLRTRRRTMVALAAVLALGGCTSSGSDDAGTSTPPPHIEPQNLVMEGKDVTYEFLLNGYEEEDPGANSVVSWHDVNTFTLDLSSLREGTEEDCRYALFLGDGSEATFFAHLGGNVGSAEVDGRPAHALVTNCIPGMAAAFQ